MAKGRAKKCEILVLNNIAQVGLKRFPAEQYAVVKEAKDPQPAIDFVRELKTSPEFEEQVEDGKKQFAGSELPGHTLGIIGLGKIGSLVADAAIRLGMNVLGYDPHITVDAAWSLPSQVRKA